jgi:hypothetical protein
MECLINPFPYVSLLNLLPVDKIWPIAMDDCIECKAIPPRMGEIVNTNIWIPMSSFFGPSEVKPLWRWHPPVQQQYQISLLS